MKAARFGPRANTHSVRAAQERKRGIAPRVGVWLGVVMVGTSCQGGATSQAALPPGPALVQVTTHEYRFDYLPLVPAGRVVFRFHNAGGVEHQPRLVALPEDVPPIDVQLRGSERRILTPFAGVPRLEPGESASFAVDLVAGRRYALLCFLTDERGELHALRGMASEFRAGEDE